MFTAANANEIRSDAFDTALKLYVINSAHLHKGVWVESRDDMDPLSADPYEERIAYIVAMMEARGFVVSVEHKDHNGDEYAEITFSWGGETVPATGLLSFNDRIFVLRHADGTLLCTYRGDSKVLAVMTVEQRDSLCNLAVGGTWADGHRRWTRTH